MHKLHILKRLFKLKGMIIVFSVVISQVISAAESINLVNPDFLKKALKDNGTVLVTDPTTQKKSQYSWSVYEVTSIQSALYSSYAGTKKEKRQITSNIMLFPIQAVDHVPLISSETRSDIKSHGMQSIISVNSEPGGLIAVNLTLDAIKSQESLPDFLLNYAMSEIGLNSYSSREQFITAVKNNEIELNALCEDESEDSITRSWSKVVEKGEHKLYQLGDEENNDKLNGDLTFVAPRLTAFVEGEVPYKIHKKFCIPYWISLESFSAKGHATADSGEIAFSGLEGELNFPEYRKEFELFDAQVLTLPVPIGPIAIPVNFDLEGRLGMLIRDSNVIARLGYRGDIDARFEFDYQCTFDGCEGDRNFTHNFTKEHLLAEVEGNTKIKVYFEPIIAVNVVAEDVAQVGIGAELGPRLDLSGYVGNCGLDSLVTYADLDLVADLNVEVFIQGELLPNKRIGIHRFEVPIGHYELTPNSSVLEPRVSFSKSLADGLRSGGRHYFEGESVVIRFNPKECYPHMETQAYTLAPSIFDSNTAFINPIHNRGYPEHLWVTRDAVLNEVGVKNFSVNWEDALGRHGEYEFQIDVLPAAPTILEQPEDFEGIAGEPVTISAKAVGKGGVNLKWITGDWGFRDNEPEINTTVKTRFGSNVVYYQLRAENEYGVTFSRTAKTTALKPCEVNMTVNSVESIPFVTWNSPTTKDDVSPSCSDLGYEVRIVTTAKGWGEGCSLDPGILGVGDEGRSDYLPLVQSYNVKDYGSPDSRICPPIDVNILGNPTVRYEISKINSDGNREYVWFSPEQTITLDPILVE